MKKQYDLRDKLFFWWVLFSLVVLVPMFLMINNFKVARVLLGIWIASAVFMGIFMEIYHRKLEKKEEEIKNGR